MWNRSFKSVLPLKSVVLMVSMANHDDALQLGTCVMIKDTDKFICGDYCP